MKILAFAASNNKNSINKQLATYAAGLVADAQVEVLDITILKCQFSAMNGNWP